MAAVMIACFGCGNKHWTMWRNQRTGTLMAQCAKCNRPSPLNVSEGTDPSEPLAGRPLGRPR